jgi:antitoxin component YwqK of YwqJK toxin-antitoxin module
MNGFYNEMTGMRKQTNPWFTISILLGAILLFSGCSKTERTYHPDGTLKSEIHKDNGRYNGLATWYYSNGLKQHEVNYVNDTLQGKSTRWYNNGTIHSVEHFKDNHLHGTVETFDMNGKRLSLQTYYLDTLHGPSVEYYTSGQPKIEGQYDKGRFDGRWIYYEDDGYIIGIGEFNKGTGKQRAWYRNGTLKREVNYTDNQKNGREIWYNADGTVSQILTYENDEVISTETVNP